MFNYSNLLSRLLQAGLASPDAVIGCSDQEIRIIEERFDLELPKVYKECLKILGKCAGSFLQGNVFLYPELLEFGDRARQKVAGWEGWNLNLPDKAFVFAEPSGEDFLFFDTSTSSEDPPILTYFEGSGHFEKVADSYSEFLEKKLVDSESYRKEPSAVPWWRSNEERAELRARRIRNSTN
jgi:hypothetical protein